MAQAQIIDGIVHWIATDLQAASYPRGLLDFVAIPEDQPVREGWLYRDGRFSPPPENAR